MDKETLSNYGWIVILVLILAVLLALATPFGNFIAGAFKATYAGFGMVGDNALGIVIPGSDKEEIDTNTQTFVPGLYQTGTITKYQSGEDVSALLITPWDELVSNGVIHVDNRAVYTVCDLDTGTNSSSNALSGDLIMPEDGSVTALGNFDMNNYVGNMAFTQCTELTGISIPDSITVISDAAFMYCEKLNTVKFIGNPQVKKFGMYAFGLTPIQGIEIPNSVTDIGMAAFSGCSNLSSVTIPESISVINPYVFHGCTKLTNVNIPSSLTAIEREAFNSCSELTNITLPSELSTIGEYVFANCTKLSNITYIGSTNKWNTANIAHNWNTNIPATAVHCSDGDVTL